MLPILRLARGLPSLNSHLFVHGAHLINDFGDSLSDLRKEGHSNIHLISTIEKEKSKVQEFATTITKLRDSLDSNKINYALIVGDRAEAYAAALSCHFLGIKIIHYGGGNISRGSADNIYRYNITNLSSIHIVTSKPAELRIKKLPTVEEESVFMAGSSSVDEIFKFIANPGNLDEFHPEWLGKPYILLTFHPVDNRIEDTAALMNEVINTLINGNKNLIITYPNHDPGCDEIIKIINKWSGHHNVSVIKNLGSRNYYTAIYRSDCVIGNSSSGFVEVPYFDKVFFNIGNRQQGRDRDESVVNLDLDEFVNDQAILEFMEVHIRQKKSNNHLYGSGNSLLLIKQILETL